MAQPQISRRQLLTYLGSGLGSAIVLPRAGWSALLDKTKTTGTAVKLLQFSGIYPHLAYFNHHGECGTGAVVPWAGRLWVITYAPHMPWGSTDKLYEIDDNLNLVIRPESVGGTPANRMIHRESNQLFIGPYAIDDKRGVRAITPKMMPGRLTGNARHLTDPANKIYYATMEEGFYEVDVHTLAVTQLYEDANSTPDKGGKLLPGYHGKGLYSGQGKLVYANNGERTAQAEKYPETISGVLAEWDGKDWIVVRRNQFTEVTGPGGIYGSSKPDTDPIWTIGWDYRSLILMMKQNGAWQSFRLPKSSHSYDGAHGWNTEWPRIREIGEKDFLMTMHGAFWRFPSSFAAGQTAGIRPRSNYLKIIGDFTQWNGHIVCGCDDTAQAEFLNSRKAKGTFSGSTQSQSNLWFLNPAQLDQLGPVIGRGALWFNEDIKGGQWSDAFLFAGYDRRGVFLSHAAAQDVTFDFEVDAKGNAQWTKLRSVTVPANGTQWIEFPATQTGEWIRVRPSADCPAATCYFNYSNTDPRTEAAAPMFSGLANNLGNEIKAGLVRPLGGDKRTLHLAATNFHDGGKQDIGCYELSADMQLRPVADPAAFPSIQDSIPIPKDVISVDAASVLYVDDKGARWRLPKGAPVFDTILASNENRVDREVVTERDVFNAHGTFYELPAENAGGFPKIRPIATHNRRINDYCSYRGMLIMTGIEGGENNPHIIRSADGKAALWAGAIDDLWQLGKPRGTGGPCANTPLKANTPSDPYLMTGYDKKSVALSADKPVNLRLEVDITGTGLWKPYQTFAVIPGTKQHHDFPTAFSAYWIRVVPSADCSATAQFNYS